jgi:Ca2+-binding RTX toxin-like protein
MALIIGNVANDTLTGSSGADEIRGLEGNDTIDGAGGDDLLLGGPGGDLIYAYPGAGGNRPTVDGGDGNDRIYAGGNVLKGGPPQIATVTGGAGDDDINHVGQYSGGLYDGGAGNDTFDLRQTEANLTVRMGSGGVDTVRYITEFITFTPAVLRIEQFQAGDGGDRLFLGLIPTLKAWDQSNPFAGGYLRLVADGADTVLQIDEDGGSNGFHDFVRLVGIAPGSITAANLGGYHPSGAPTQGAVFVGSPLQSGTWVQIDATAGGDTITGQATNDLIHALAGNDLINTGGGNDFIHAAYGDDTVGAGAGNDTITDEFGANYLRGDDGNDSIRGGSQFDDINGNVGNDTASGGTGDDWVVGGKDNDSLFGEAGGDLVYGNLGADTCEGGEGNDIVRGGQDNDSVSGGAGDDYVSGDKGDDTVAGGAGADLFHTFGDAGIDRVTDFSLAQGDRVLLDPGTQYTVAQSGADTVISMTGGGQMILVGVQMTTLTTGWIFGA